jgi:phosphoglycerol transferase MdoB-like AlkP superfamily enzyme
VKQIFRWLNNRPYIKLILLSFAVGLLTSSLVRLLFPFGSLHLWIVLDYAMESLFVVALYAFCPSMTAVLVVQGLLGGLIRGVNAAKIFYLDMPILPSDLFLSDDLFAISTTPRLIIYAAVFLIPLSICLYVLVKNWRWPKGQKWLITLPALTYFLWFTIFPSHYVSTFEKLTKDQLFGVPFLIKQRGQVLGVPLSFTIDLAQFLKLWQRYPSKEEVEKSISTLWSKPPLKPRTTAQVEKLKPNVYVILAESFWDSSGMLDISNAQLMAPEFMNLWRQSGQRNFLTPTFGGGTANVEFEILCGIPARAVTKGVVFQVALSHSIPCLPQVLADAGYHTYAFHPFNAGFYNRVNAYRLLGFEKYFSIKDYKPDATAGDFVADQQFLKESIRRARENSGGQPFFAYMLTFAGHWPYAWLPELYTKSIHLNGKHDKPDLEIVERHLNINLITSSILAQTIAEIKKEDPTSLIVVAGDHLPGLVNSLLLDVSEQDITDWRFFRTPLIIIGEKVIAAPAEVPAYYLPREILSRLEISQLHDRFFNWTPPKVGIVRPLQSGANLVSSGGLAMGDESHEFAVCTPSSLTSACQDTGEWLRNFRVFASDLLFGSQHSLKLLDSTDKVY